MRLNAQQLRELEEKRAQGEIKAVKRNPIYFILEDIYDTYNIGGLFRLADAIAVEKIYLCGESEIPPNTRIKKASIGTYKIVPWEYKRNSEEVIEEIRKNPKSQLPRTKQIPNFKSQIKNNLTMKQFNNETMIVAVEQHPNATDYRKADYRLPLALIFGNESYGVKPETLELVDQIVEIPMFGVNKSLNVIVSAAIVSYWVMSQKIIK